MKKFAITILLAAVVTGAGSCLAADGVMAEARNIWTETGDLLGQENFLTAGLSLDDQLGQASKAAEDLGPMEDTRFTGIFNWSDTYGDGRWYNVRGLGDQTGGPGGVGDVQARGGKTGRYSFLVGYTRGEHCYDMTSEKRLGMPEPPAMSIKPTVVWKRGVFRTRYKLNKSLSLSAGAQDIMREGVKASLLRNAGDVAPPGRKDFDTTQRLMWLGADWTHGKLAVGAKAGLQANDGNRDLNLAHDWQDDRSTWTLATGLNYAAVENLTLLGSYSLAGTTSKPIESAGATRNELNRTRQAGVFGAMWQPARHARLKVSAAIRNLDGDGAALTAATPYAYDRSRSSQRYRADFVYTGLKKTRVKADLSYRSADLTETVSELAAIGGAPVDEQVTDQTVTTLKMSLQMRHRFNTRYTAKAGYVWQSRDVEQVETGDMRYWMGDRKTDTNHLDLALGARLTRTISLDGGYQMIRQTFERTDITGVETTWDADRAFVTASWLAGEKLSVYGSVWFGQEAYQIGDWVDTPDIEQSATTYDATTLRYAPGLSYRLFSRTIVSGSYEAVRNSDSVENDFDRWQVRVDHSFNKSTTVAAAYRRYEFDENRLDDYILDRYSLSMTKLF